MSYSKLPPAPGGRRDRRLREQARLRTYRQVAATSAVVALAAGTFSTAGASEFAHTWFGADDAVALTTEAPLQAADVQVEVVTETTTNEIANDTIEQPNFDLTKGTRVVVQEGAPGTELVSYTVTTVNGVEVGRTPGIVVVMDEPTDEIVSVGALTIPPATAVQKGTNRELGQSMAASMYGWSGDQWACLDNLWQRESGWSHTSHNTSSGAYGIPQALPGDKMAAYGADWATNPATQIKWGLAYVSGRYGTPCGAWAHFTQKNWY